MTYSESMENTLTESKMRNTNNRISSKSLFTKDTRFRSSSNLKINEFFWDAELKSISIHPSAIDTILHEDLIKRCVL